MRQFEIKAKLAGYYTAEDPKCPRSWRGSGVYDISIPCHVTAVCTVWAEDEDRAERLVDGHDFEYDPNPCEFTVEEMDILSISDTGITDDTDEEEIQIEYKDFWEYERD